MSQHSYFCGISLPGMSFMYWHFLNRTLKKLCDTSKFWRRQLLALMIFCASLKFLIYHGAVLWKVLIGMKLENFYLLNELFRLEHSFRSCVDHKLMKYLETRCLDNLNSYAWIIERAIRMHTSGGVEVSPEFPILGYCALSIHNTVQFLNFIHVERLGRVWLTKTDNKHMRTELAVSVTESKHSKYSLHLQSLKKKHADIKNLVYLGFIWIYLWLT